MITQINSAAAMPPDTTIPKASAASGVNSLANENTFLKLLVAQLKNQDPLQPQDGTQFVAQLAQFSGLEQTIGIKQDLDSILTMLKAQNSASNPSAAHLAAS